MTEGELKKRIREERLNKFHDLASSASRPVEICTHLTIEECIENDCGIGYVYKVLDEMKADFPLFYHDLTVLKATLLKHEKTISMNNKGAIQIIEWFEKWLGEKEEPEK